MNTRDPLSRWVSAAAVAAALLAGGCQSPAAKPGNATGPTPAQETARPNFGPPMQDVRTEAIIQQMELDYIAAKNSRPTHQQAAAEKKAKEQARAEAARKAEAAQQAEASQATGTKVPEAKP